MATRHTLHSKGSTFRVPPGTPCTRAPVPAHALAPPPRAPALPTQNIDFCRDGVCVRGYRYWSLYYSIAATSLSCPGYFCPMAEQARRRGWRPSCGRGAQPGAGRHRAGCSWGPPCTWEAKNQGSSSVCGWSLITANNFLLLHCSRTTSLPPCQEARHCVLRPTRPPPPPPLPLPLLPPLGPAPTSSPLVRSCLQTVSRWLVDWLPICVHVHNPQLHTLLAPFVPPFPTPRRHHLRPEEELGPVQRRLDGPRRLVRPDVRALQCCTQHSRRGSSRNRPDHSNGHLHRLAAHR